MKILTVNASEAPCADFWYFPLIFWREVHIAQPFGQIQYMPGSNVSGNCRCRHLALTEIKKYHTKPCQTDILMTYFPMIGCSFSAGRLSPLPFPLPLVRSAGDLSPLPSQAGK